MKTTFKTITIAIIVFLLSSQTSNAQCNADDWYALKDFYNSLGGPNWINNEGWVDHIADHNSPPPDCELLDFYGILSTTTDQVSRIELPNNNLTGTIPSSIGNFQQLDKLDLKNNNISGTIPSELSQCLFFNSLDLSFNNIEGGIPIELTTLITFFDMVINNNNMSGCYEFNLTGQSLSSWCSLSLFNSGGISAGNNFDASWDDFCATKAGACPQGPNCHPDDWLALKALYNSTNGPNWYDLPNIRPYAWDAQIADQDSYPTVGCDLNVLVGIDVNAQGRVSKVNLDFFGKIIEGPIPSDIEKLTYLTELGFQNELLTGPIPPELGNLQYLTHLDLSYNNFNSPLPSNLGNLQSLEYLDIGRSNLTGPIPTSIDGLNSIKEIILFGNQLTGPIPSQLGSLRTLEKLYLNQNILNGNIPTGLGALVNLTILDLSQNGLTGPIPADIGNLESLTGLSLDKNSLDGNIPMSFINLENIEGISLANNLLTGSIPDFFGGFESLVRLDLGPNTFSGSIPESLGSLSNLTFLNLYGNSLTGNIPASLGNLTNLEVLFLFRNNLTGNIPASLGNLTNLKDLIMFQNELTGGIPKELGNLNSLEELSIEQNKLAGCFPSELKTLCGQLTVARVFSNNFHDTWLNFCNNDGGVCTNNCDAEEWYALKALYNSTNGNSWTNQSGWEDIIAPFNNPPANYNLANLYGITLNADGKVTCIDLDGVDDCSLTLDGTGNNLTGNIPVEIANLCNLTHFNLGYNNLTGSIPSEFRHLTYLEHLCLPNNQLDGIMPEELKFLSFLTELVLHENNLTGGVPALVSENLTTISLHNNQLDGFVSPSILDLENLTHLYLNDNQLFGTLDQAIKATNLQELEIQNNRFFGCYNESVEFLCSVIFKDEQVSDGNNFDAAWEDFCAWDEGKCDPCSGPELRTELSQNTDKIDNCDRNDWEGLRQLYRSASGESWYNNINWNAEFGNRCFPSLNCDLGNLYGVTLNENGRVGALDLSGNNLFGLIPDDVNSLFGPSGSIGSLSELTELNLSENGLVKSIPTAISRLSNLEVLDLSNNDLSGNIPTELFDLVVLRSSDLKSKQLKISKPKQLNPLSKLQFLNLSNNQFEGSIPGNISNLTTLNYLNLGFNLLSGIIPDLLSNLNILEILLLNDNQLTGEIPAGFTGIPNLENINLTNNELSGCYSEDIAAFCGQFGNSDISDGNSFEARFEDFCRLGSSACDECINDAGLMQSSSTMVCGGESIFIREVFSEIDQSSTKAYIMHQTKTFDGKNYISYQLSGRFSSPGENYNNQPVYISAVAGPAGNDGLPMLDNACTTWTSYGAYIVFFDPVTITVVNETCNDGQYSVDVQINGGVGGRSPSRAYRSVSDGFINYQNVGANEILTFGPYEDMETYRIEAIGAKGCIGSATENIPCTGLLRTLSYTSNSNIIVVSYSNREQHIQAVEGYNLNGQQIPIEFSVNHNQIEIRLFNEIKGLYLIKITSINNEIDYIKIMR